MTLRYIDLHLPTQPVAPVALQLSEEPWIHPSAFIRDSQIGSWTEIAAGCVIDESVIDDYSYATGDNQIAYSIIGKFVNIASHVRINPTNHPMTRVTQHHMTYRRKQYGFAATDDERIFDWRRSQACSIGHDVWIGHAAILVPGVQVATGAVVGAGAVVTKNVDPYTIVAGVPAKPIRKRFADDVIERLLATAWWDWDRATLEERFYDLNDIALFLEKYGG